MIDRRDLPVGIALLLIALLVLWHVQSFPPAPGQPYGAALFPGIAAAGLGLVAIALIVQALRADPAAGGATAARSSGDGPDPAAPAAGPSRTLAIGLTAGAIVFYLVAAETLGFLICGTLILAALMWAYGVRPALNLPIAIGVTVLIHVAFYSGLRVPLPWGVLQPFAW